MQPEIPIDQVVTTPSPTRTSSAERLGGIRRGLVTFGLAIGLLAFGGAAVVLAASHEPSSSGTPTDQTSTTEDSSGSTDHPAKGDRPEGSDGRDPAASPSTGTSS